MALHLAILAAAARGHRKRHGNARPRRRLQAIRSNHRAELTYRAALLQLVYRCREIVEDAFDEFRAYWPRPNTGDSVTSTDAVPTAAKQFIAKAKGKLGNLDAWAKRMAGLAAEANKDSVDSRLSREIQKAIGVDVSSILRANGPMLASMGEATQVNVALIKTIPEQYLDRIYKTVTDGWTQGMRWESLVEQIQEDGNITENRAKLIARDQTSKMNAAFNEERQQQVGIDKFEWSTSEDERVRESHAELDGKTFSWDDPPTVDGEVATPGSQVQCRCVAIPVVDMDILGEAGGPGEDEREAA
jgi:SPP1 gp7 family putative phage head morphogenesis protein